MNATPRSTSLLAFSASAFKMEVRGSAKTHWPDIMTAICTAARAMDLVLNPAETSVRSLEQSDWTSPRNLQVHDTGVEYSPLVISTTQFQDTLDDFLSISELAIATVLPCTVKNAETLDFNDTNLTALIKNKIYKVHMCIEITLNTLRLTVCIFDKGAGPNLVHTSFFTGQLHNHVCLIHNMSLEDASNSPVHFIGKDMPFVQLEDLHVRVCFVVINYLSISL